MPFPVEPVPRDPQHALARKGAVTVDAMGAAAGVVFRPVIGLEPLVFWAARRAGDDRRPVLDFTAAAVDSHPDAIGQ